MGGASDRVGNRASLIVGFTIQLASLLLLQFTRETWMFYLFAVIFGFSSGGVIVLVASTVAEFFGLKAHGVIMGLSVSVHALCHTEYYWPHTSLALEPHSYAEFDVKTQPEQPVNLGLQVSNLCDIYVK